VNLKLTRGANSSMLIDRKGKMIAAVRGKCQECPGCNKHSLEVILYGIVTMQSLLDIDAAPIEGTADTYSVEVNSTAHLRFAWKEPYVTKLELVCRGPA
jgi:hypothetical protein